MRAVNTKSDHYAQNYYIEKLLPVRNFIASHKNKESGKLILSDLDKLKLTRLVYGCIGVQVSFDHTGLSYLEILDLAISPFVTASHNRAWLLCTSSGVIRNIGSSINMKLNANNRFHALMIALSYEVIVFN